MHDITVSPRCGKSTAFCHCKCVSLGFWLLFGGPKQELLQRSYRNVASDVAETHFVWCVSADEIEKTKQNKKKGKNPKVESKSNKVKTKHSVCRLLRV